MSDSDARVQKIALRRIVTWYLLPFGVLAGVFYALQGWFSVLAVFYGMLIIVLNHLQQVRQLARADSIAGLSAERNMRYLYRCAFERFVATVALLAIGIILIRLEPLPLLCAYIVGHITTAYQGFLKSNARRRHG
jgi:4-hydroxybenzoate polyprenyltransferase